MYYSVLCVIHFIETEEFEDIAKGCESSAHEHKWCVRSPSAFITSGTELINNINLYLKSNNCEEWKSYLFKN